MLTIMSKSKEPCFVCSGTQHCMEVKIKVPRFVGSMCASCLFKRVPEKKEVSDADPEESG